MDQATLVGRLERAGEQLTAKLRDDPSFDLTASFWWWNSESSAWLLVIASKNYERLGPKSTYQHVRRLLKKLDTKRSSSPLDLSMISAVSATDPRVAAMASAISVSSGHARVTRSNLNGVQVDDALIYELSLAGVSSDAAEIPASA